MNKMTNGTKVSLLMMGLLSFGLDAASFDCDKAATHVENMICQDNDLSLFDDVLARNYHELRSLLTELEISQVKDEQRHWMTIRNTSCNTIASCLSVYSHRIVELKQRTSEEKLKRNLHQYVNMNQLIWDRAFSDYIHAFFGETQSKMLTLKYLPAAEEIRMVLGGPPNDLERIGTTVIGSACRAHSCPEKGIVVIDTSSLEAIFGVIHYITEEGDVGDDPMLSVYYRDNEFLTRHIESLKAAIKRHSDFKQVEFIKIVSTPITKSHGYKIKGIE